MFNDFFRKLLEEKRLSAIAVQMPVSIPEIGINRLLDEFNSLQCKCWCKCLIYCNNIIINFGFLLVETGGVLPTREVN